MNRLSDYLRASAAVVEETAVAIPEERVERAVSLICRALRDGLPLLVCGCGGSAADAAHVTAELVGRFARPRRALRVICLSSCSPLLTAWSNDVSFGDVFARQVDAYGAPGAVLMAISTSGVSPSVVGAARRAKSLGMGVVSLTGRGGGRLAPFSDVLLDVPSSDTPLIQQAHVCLYHHLCARIEEETA